ncbi:cytochrome c [Alkalihalobacillus sp. LMS39]|uniref:c-type cytochrome n=1 Tax=Alkalihalobacillus sp. LMS39 TaxID=2924032 RepID=UPI001FB243F2|nr:cytochrome c [Alkalihalobacillus sp. LMS39]UOE93778.1 cytochrome c [Alkalihalobacillus sp. LMS39]
MRKRILAVIGVSFLMLAGCGAGNDAAPAEETPAETEAPADETTGDLTYDAAQAEEDYRTTGCINCHGGNLEGQGSTPGLTGGKYTAEEILYIIEHGQGTMPKGLISGPEAENLAAWIADQ